MLIKNSQLINTPILSLQDGSPVGFIIEPIIDPDSFKVIAFKLGGSSVTKDAFILDVKSIRENSDLGMIIDSAEDLVGEDDVVKISKALELRFNPIGLKVESKKGSKLGKVINYNLADDDFTILQIIVKRPTFKAFLDPELTISRKEIVEITDYKIIVKDEEKVLKQRAEKEDFIPNFVNPFREKQPGYAASDTDEIKG